LVDGQGLVVVNVAPDSAAAKAGLQQHDVIVKINDTKLAHVPDLSKAVNAADGKGVSLAIIRGGKEQTLAIVPEERYQNSSPSFQLVKPGMGMVMGRGMVMPDKTMQMQVHLPDNLSISVQRKGSEPARITVKRGDENWEITDKELDKLPPDVRPHVERMLGAGPMMLNIGTGGGGGFGGGGGTSGVGGGGFGGGGQIILGDGPDGNKFFKLYPNPPDAPAPQKVAPREGASSSADLMKRLEQLDERLQKMQEEMNRLREENRK